MKASYRLLLGYNVSKSNGEECDKCKIESGSEVPALDEAVEDPHDAHEHGQEQQSHPQGSVHFAVVTSGTAAAITITIIVMIIIF